ncbi:MAG TPA: [Fe-S]-binding protein [Solibacterales bacterium]|nr:[Fe-S]-binding protein [Bryobacterales bacterium]
MPLYAEPHHFAVYEKVLLALAILASAWVFWQRFGVVVERIRSAKKDPAFSLDPLGPRIWEFFWEVLCQAKVIRQRPLPGLAHAFVFWGFCAFALVTTNHFAAGFGLGFLPPDSFIGKFYFFVAGLFGVTVALSIAGLAFRRFVIRPEWLGKHLSGTSAIIATLIFTLMVTYLGAFFVTSESTAVKILWWVHTLALLVFMPIIPRSKHLHLILSPVTVFLSRGQFSAIPPLSGDEDFGLVNGKDVTQLAALQAYSCVECGRCTEHCPAANTGKELNPKEIILGLKHYLDDVGPQSEEPLLGKHNSQKAAFQCTTCGSCEFQCPVGIEHLPIIIGMRRGSVNTGTWEDDYGTKLFLSLERGGNVLGMNASERDKFIAKQGFPIYDGSQEYCLWMGCMGSFDPAGREIVVALTKVMSHLGVTYGVLKKEKCTGDSARRLGNDLLFQQLAEQNLNWIKQAKATKLISICPHCVRTISTDWKEFGEPPAIEHHSEFLARHAAKLPGHQNGTSIVFHDPCYLGRYRNVYEEPRSVAGRFGTLVEAGRSRERSFCCGAGGGLALLGEEEGDRVSHVRAQQLMDSGANTVAVACPFCNTMFRDALTVKSANPPELYDIAQLAAKSLPS